MKMYKWYCDACGGTGRRGIDHCCQSCWGKGHKLTIWGEFVELIRGLFLLIFLLVRFLLIPALIILAVFVVHTYFPELTGKIVEILGALLERLREVLGIVR